MTVRLQAVPATTLLAGLGAAALLADRVWAAGALAALLAAVCLRGPRGARRLYLVGALLTGAGVLVVSPFLAVEGAGELWRGPTLPLLGPLDVTVEELETAALNALRLAALGLAFAAYALHVEHDELVAAASFARRSSLAVALATRLVPTLQRDAAALAEAVRGRGVDVTGLRGHARLLSPLVAGSLERASSLAEAMEARGFGGARPTRAPRPAWRAADRAAVAAAALAVAVGALWL